MNKKVFACFLGIVSSLALCSCKSEEEINPTIFMTEYIAPCGESEENLIDQYVCVENNRAVLPFDSGMNLTVYSEDIDSIKLREDYVKTMAKISATFDRHYKYKFRNDLDDEFESLFNLYDFNSKIEETLKGEQASLSVDLNSSKELFDGLKQAYEFSLGSALDYSGEKHMKYNFAIGALSDLYSKYIERAQSLGYQGDGGAITQELVKLENKYRVLFAEDFSNEELNNSKVATPTYEELQKLFEFDDENNKVTINKIEKEFANNIYPSITLSGYAKGRAEEIFKSLYPDLPFLINGGSSSLMTNKTKTKDKPWTIRIDNPLYNEELEYGKIRMPGAIFEPVLTDLNSHDVYFKSKENFVLSTSGYYNNYYYAKDENGNIILRHHIIDSYTGESMNYFDSTSILISDAGFADMYSTALMNCSSVEEAEKLRKQLDEKFNFETWAFYMAHDKISSVSQSQVKDGLNVYVPSSKKSIFYLMNSSQVEYPLVSTFKYF